MRAFFSTCIYIYISSTSQLHLFTEAYMKHSYEQIQREVRRRTRKYRRRYEQVTLTILSMLCLILSGSMLPLLSRAGMASSTVPGGYSSVLLHSGASAYVVVGIAAFVTGCIVTALCLYLKKRRSKRD